MGCIGNIHSGEFADHGLELEDSLEHALADLSLIGSVAGNQFFAAGDLLYHSRNEVAIGAGTAEYGLKDLVCISIVAHSLSDFHLGKSGSDVQLVQNHVLGNILVELFHAAKAKGCQHLLLVLGCIRNIGTHYKSFLSITGDESMSASPVLTANN